jgi:hypothetical protein
VITSHDPSQISRFVVREDSPKVPWSHAERTIFRRANGGDHPGGGSRSSGGGGQAARHQRADDLTVCAVSALWLSAHPHFPRPRRPSHKPWPGRTGCGKRQGCRCRASGRGSASPLRRGHARKHRVGPNQVWCYDFVFDHCANGQQLKCLTVADEFTKEGLAIDVDGRIRSARVHRGVVTPGEHARRPEVSAQRQRARVRV